MSKSPWGPIQRTKEKVDNILGMTVMFTWKLQLTLAWSWKPHSCLFFSLIPTHSDSFWTKEKCQKARFGILDGYYSFLPWSWQYLRPSPNTQLLTILGHKFSLWQTPYHPMPTIYKVSLLLFVGMASLALISETGESAWELLCSNKLVILFQFSLIWLTVLVEKPIMGWEQKIY